MSLHGHRLTADRNKFELRVLRQQRHHSRLSRFGRLDRLGRRRSVVGPRVGYAAAAVIALLGAHRDCTRRIRAQEVSGEAGCEVGVDGEEEDELATWKETARRQAHERVDPLAQAAQRPERRVLRVLLLLRPLLFLTLRCPVASAAAVVASVAAAALERGLRVRPAPEPLALAVGRIGHDCVEEQRRARGLCTWGACYRRCRRPGGVPTALVEPVRRRR
mmetsp:Transcript_7900/g.18040  ORF Transcript_7900/g.18040 Transcript_7900/m.18040 type:complete len:219 (+) Transcript_7900:232-888(+)